MQSESDRDRTVERLLRQSLKARAALASRGPCLEAETLAAWADGALAGDELAAAEVHASDCSRCQAMLAAIARDEGAPDSPPPLALDPASFGGRRASGPAPAWWRSGSWLGWLVPLTAAAAALALWIAVPRESDQRSIEQAQARATVPSSPKAPEPQQQESSRLADGGPASTVEAGKPRADERRGQAKDKAENATPIDALQSLEKGVAINRDRAASDPGRRATEAVTGSPGAAPLKGRPTSAAEESLKARPTEALAERAAQLPAAAPTTALPAAGGANAVTSARESVAIAATSAPPLEILSPDRSSRWRPGAAGAVQRSSDGGATWEALATGVPADLTAGAAPSSSVVWLVGRAGTVLLSTDGRRWQRVPFPEAVDVTAVTAIDARTATVTTADGRRFSTADGGLTWHQL